MPRPDTQELYCHECQQYVQFTLDFDRDGAHEIECPNCGHIHCRIVEDGRITEARWDSRNNSWVNSRGTSYTITYTASAVTTSATSIDTWDMWPSDSTGGTSAGYYYIQQ